MAKKLLVGMVGLTLLASGAAWAGQAYELDSTHSRIGFSVRHMGISSVNGQFNEYGGEILIDEEDLTRSSVSLAIKTASVDTGDEQRDGHLRSDDFFNSEQFPEMKFQSSSIAALGDGEFVLTGSLTIRDKTLEVEIPVVFGGPVTARGGKRIGIEGAVTIDRQDYGLKFDVPLDGGGLLVGNDVKILFSIEAKSAAE